MTSTIYTGVHAGKRARKAWGRRKKLAVVATAGVLALGTGTAWAAYALFGYGSFDAGPATVANLSVHNSAQLTGQLVPGASVGAKAEVENSNDFSVTVTNVLIKNSSVSATGDPSCESTVHLGPGTATTWPDGGGAATQFELTEVVIPAGQTRTVTVNNVVRQDASAMKLCGVHADFAVRAQTAS